MKQNISIFAILFLSSICGAHALEYNSGNMTLKLTGYGTAGFIEPDFNQPDFLGDFRARGQMNYEMDNVRTFGLVYAIDAAALDEDDYMREAFTFLEQRGLGRIELGFTDSVARKLSVGLPDVGGMRVNDKPLFYKKIRPDGAFISDTTLTTGRDAFRLNVVSASMRGLQYGASVAAFADDYDYSIDAGIKIRRPAGKLKTAYSFSASFTENVDGFTTDAYTAPVFADWRAQGAIGMNLQYNSWILGMNVRAIYDENPVGIVSDGISAGTGISYDLLKYSVSLSYIFSDTGIWDSDTDNYDAHTVIGSFRYKYSSDVDFWLSLGMTTDTPFVSVALRLNF
ncbi:MAG: hypothetical protein IJ560_01960 [Alphaproteobacteria bacterium]|nr:hypothetical protein [Alphaproteobacteria bacterium]